MKLALWILAVSLVTAALSLWLIGFPGICGFTGVYGERLSSTSFGLIAAMALVYLPAMGVFAGILGVFVTGIYALITRHDRHPPNR